MFNCQKCKKTQSTGTKQERIVIETRPVTYTKDIIDRTSGEHHTIVVGNGNEIVKQLNVCTKCKSQHEEQSLRQAA